MKILQWSTFAGACILCSAAIGYNFQGKNEAQLAALTGAWGLSIVSAYAEHLDLEPDQMLRMIKSARLDLFEQLLDRRCHQVYDAAVEVAALPSTEKQAIVLFDWNLIKNDPDKWPHLAIVGGTGDGKTTLTQSLIQYVGEKAIAIDPHYKPGNYPGIPRVAKGRNYGDYPGTDIGFEKLVNGTDCSYTDAIATIHKEMDVRFQYMRKGELNFTPYLFILDEYSTFAGIHPNCSKTEVLSLVREARKVNIRLIFLVQSDLLEDFKWQGQGAARKSLRWVRLGEFAQEYADKKIKDEIISQWVSNQTYPMLVEKLPALLPMPLSQLRSFNNNLQVNHNQSDNNSHDLPAPKQWIEHLNKMYELPYELPERNDTDGSRTSDAIEPGERPELLSEKGRTNERTDNDPSDGRVIGGSFEPEPNELHYYSQILKLHKQGMNKSQTIKQLWDVSRGGGPTYKKASEVYDNAQKHWESLKLW